MTKSVQYAILKYSPKIRSDSIIRLYFATAYNKFGEEAIWQQGRVQQYFGPDELLIGRDFWNFICDSTKETEWYSRHIKNMLLH